MKTMKILTAMLCAGLWTVGHAAAQTSGTPALDAELHKVELTWEHVKFQEDGQPQQFDDMAAVAKQAQAIAAKYPGRAEPLIWEGIAVSEQAGLASMLHAMTYAKEAKKILEKADGISPAALDAGAPTCLGVLYYRVPGFPLGFGDTTKARELLKEAGYDGRPIVLLQVSDIASLANLGPIAKAQFERAGFKVDMRPADWQTHLARVLRKEPPEDRGWNVTLSSTGVLDVVNPVTSLFLNSACDKASAGWPCDAAIEALRNEFALEPDAARRKAIAEQIQARAMELGTHYPLGEWYSASAVSTRTSGWVRPPSATAFWNVELKR